MARDEAPRSRPNHNYVVNPPPPEYMDRLNRICTSQSPLPDFLLAY